jgi:cyclophilin family peptidyl-prolyl cis-trans isomerase
MRAWAAALGEVADDVARFELKRMLARGAAPNAERAELLAVPAVLRALARAKDPALQDLARPWFASKDGVVLRALADIYAPQAGTPAPWRPIIQAYSGIASEQDPETKIALLNRLEGWLDAGEVKSFLRQALQDRVRQARARAALLLMRAGEPGVPVDPGPSAPSMTDLTYMLVASARQDRTIAILETDRGRIEIELFREDAPLTVENFVNLARSGYFNGRSFMRVVPYFVVQGGDPRDDQEGGPGYAIRCEINMRPFERGSVGMALAGKDTGGSQFFITLSPQPHLDGGYTCFGRVISGMEAADRMTPGDRILRVTIEDEITWLDYRRY